MTNEQKVDDLAYDTNSWHYRLMGYVWKSEYEHRRHPTNLCPYLRRLVMSILLIPGIAIWRQLPDVITDHEDIAKGAIIYGFIIHIIMIGITISSGGAVFTGTTDAINTQFDYTCSIPYEVKSCESGVIEKASRMIFVDDGKILHVTLTLSGEREYTTIEWWFGWAIYFGTIAGTAATIAGAVGVMALYDKLMDRKGPHKKSETRRMMSSYIEAKHNKICPCIVFVDKKKPKDDSRKSTDSRDTS